MTKKYINVAYQDRAMAKKLGAKWDPSVRRWYCPSGSPLAKIFSWRKAANASLATANDAVAHLSAVPQQATLNFELPLAS